MDITYQMNHISSEQSTFGRVAVHVLAQSFVSYLHHLQRTECVLGVVYDRYNGIVDIGTVFEVIGVEEFHVVGFTFDIVGPAGRLNEGSTFVIAEVVDGSDEISEVDGCVGVQLIESDFCDGCSEHVSYIPPGKSQDG